MSVRVKLGPELRKVIPEGYEVRATAEVVLPPNMSADIGLELCPIYKPVDLFFCATRHVDGGQDDG